MGEVYRARDTKLKRDVALKVLPEVFAKDPGRMFHFQREAEVPSFPSITPTSPTFTAWKNAPWSWSWSKAHHRAVARGHHVAHLATQASSSQREGPMPFEDAWKIAMQIADALEYAHEKGVHGEFTGSSGYRSLVQASTVPPPPVQTETSWRYTSSRRWFGRRPSSPACVRWPL
jgi:serine/threonine protein kinase